RKAISYAHGLGGAAMAVMALAQAMAQPPPAPAPAPPPNPDSQYRLGPDSLPQEGVPKGALRRPFVIPSQGYPGTQHTYWVYVPVQYDPAVRRPSWSSRTARRSRTSGGTCGRRT